MDQKKPAAGSFHPDHNAHFYAFSQGENIYVV